jgi:hypothetical protein
VTSRSLGSDFRVRFDRDRLNRAVTERNLSAIVTSVPELRTAWADAVDGGVWAPRRENGRPSTHQETDPTTAAAFSPTRRQLREAAKQAGDLIAEARSLLQQAADTLHRAQLRQDPEVLARDLEKRQAATQRRA